MLIQSGMYPMLYSFFDEQGDLRIDPFRVQVDVALDGNAVGIAILGLTSSRQTYGIDNSIIPIQKLQKYYFI